VETSTATRADDRRFRHAAAFYTGLDGLAGLVAPFVQEGLRHEESVLVALLPDRIAAVEKALGSDASDVEFVDMGDLGRNPARLIPLWQRFVDRARGRPARGVGEPVWRGRRSTEVAECVLHESLLNVAFDGGPPWRLMCPYDAQELPEWTLAEARRTHPIVAGSPGCASRPASEAPSPAMTPTKLYQGARQAVAGFTAPLPEPPADVDAVPFGPADLAVLRGVVRRLCRQAGLAGDTVDDLVLAVHELAANSVGHAGGEGTVLAWTEPGAFVLEVRDGGTIENPLVGRELALGCSEGGRGIWMANQLCDLVQVRSNRTGTAVRISTWL
jgi:anti-sigma regulatory factor (Ser/Thr protein kinase)